MPDIKDLKADDTFTGKIGKKEYNIDGDTITMSVVNVTSETTTAQELADKKVQLTNDIAYRQSMLAEVNARLELLTK
jgi:hypothetical protein